MSLTNRSLDTIKVGKVIWDEKLQGFGARKQSVNGSISFILKTRIGGRQTIITIGRYGVLTIQAARAEALRLLGMISSGQDPIEARDLQDFRVRDIANAWLERHVCSLKPSSAKRYKCLIRDYIGPKLGRTYADKLTPQMVVRFHDALGNKPRTANYCVSTLSSMWGWANKRGLINLENPCLGIQRYDEVKRKRYLTAPEIKLLAEAFREEEQINPFAVAAIKILIMTGARLGEILSAKWEWIDGDILKLPDSKTGAKDITLPSPVLDILGALPRLEGNPHIIVGKINGQHMVNLRKPWMRIVKGAGIEHVRLHDLRHSFASFAVSSGVSLTLIGGQLGHRSIATTQRYAHLARDPVRQATETTANIIAEALQANG
tara:strand:- start:348 stop:1475 length:1128 start_codon:yes stop_codon:yes gene_type:complete